jgi:hypothetical protein
MLRREEISASARLIRRGGALALAIAITVILLALLDDTSNDYPAIVAEKHARIGSLTSPKIVIVGGSNAAFGIDSHLIQAQLGRPVVNMALWADVGLPFMFKEVEPYLRRNDLLIITPEYELFYQGALGDEARYRAAVFLPRPWSYMTSSLDGIRFVLAVIVDRGQATLQKSIRSILGHRVDDAVYSRRAFNELGDVIAHLRERPKLDTAEWNPTTGAEAILDDRAFSTLRDFAVRMTNRGVKTVFMPPAILDLQYRREKANIDRVYQRISLVGADRSLLVLGTPAGFAFPAREMYDTHYHLNREGRILRTQRMLDLLRESALIR